MPPEEAAPTEFEVTKPVLTPTGDGQWHVEWSRDGEIQFVAGCQHTAAAPKLIVLRNVDNVNKTQIMEGIKKVISRNIIQYDNIQSGDDLWQIVIAGFLDRGGLTPRSLGLMAVSAFRLGSVPGRAIEPLKQLAGASSSMYKSNYNQTAAEVLSKAGFVLDNMEDLDIKIVGMPFANDKNWQAAIVSACQANPQFKAYIEDTIFVIDGFYYNIESLIRDTDVPGLRVIMALRQPLKPAGVTSKGDGVVELACSVIGVDACLKLLAPFWDDPKVDPNRKALISLLIEERARAVSGNALVLGEQEFVRAVETLRLAVANSTNLHDLDPRAAPIDAIVVNDQIVLSSASEDITLLPSSALEQLRAQYYSDAERIAGVLQGTNAAGAFKSRIDTVWQTLSRPLDEQNCLLLGDRVRALEVMLPSTSEVLTDSTASDVTAFVSGLSLLVRQFPSWRNFVSEARQSTVLSREDREALSAAGANLENASDNTISEPLKDALRATASVREGLEDNILEFADLRSINNVYRAAARWVNDRAKGTTSSFNKAFDKKLGEALAETAIGGIITGARAVLLHLAVSMPLEFGYLIGFVLMTRKKDKED